MKLLIIDNNDSFTYNLVQMVEEAGCDNFDVLRHNLIQVEQAKKYDKFLISPGPSLPGDYPVINKLFSEYAGSKSFLGICLGMQALNEYFGGTLYNMKEVVHGQEHQVNVLKKDSLFNTLPNQISAGLYHSWAVKDDELPACLEVIARSTSGIIMALRHKQFDMKGLQFHPESIITKHGFQILKNWIDS